MDPAQHTHSVTRLVQQLRAGGHAEHQRAAAELWERYVTRLAALARKHLSPLVRRREDEEDVLQSVYKSFCLRQRRGDFLLADRQDLWRLLATIVANKAANTGKKHKRSKRDAGRELAIGGAGPGAQDAPSPLDHVAAADPGPAEAILLAEELEHRLSDLDDQLRKIAVWKLQGYTNEEIAGPTMMDCAVRTVERKLERIRERWENLGKE